MATPTGPATPSAATIAPTDEPIHIINVAIKKESYSNDEEHSKKCYEFVQVKAARPAIKLQISDED